ncbi:alpha-amylase family glycosyl hydrolase [Deinococcus sp. KNUC1210]|uniref:alpha-amylase family glycosyl hydrolase n=1 Tax=Deinococcus sp. KNUC1210 TaxID=2917691 RepID=UPI001EF09A41|nr:alpha-amylase family glycosyl hydrolase [Deinococcus sp. KNUC1210]ULH14858.1 alpha-amylase family glycosyl hydrolase [Deinococcus sp. KNUC1210]
MTSPNLKWWQSGIIYQIYPRSFQDSSGDGVGDLRGITSRLDYLSSLGIQAIWLSPIFPSPMKDFGYDVADYKNVDPLFGNLADFDELVQQAHARGLKVMLDFVPNHSSNEHPWFVEARSSRDNPKRDWYMWRDPAPDGGVPNNWKSFFGGDAWTFDETTGQYYLHQFVSEQPELNWANPEVREEMADTVRFWMRRGVDGFRVDVIWLLAKDPEYRDEPRNPEWRPEHPLHNSLEHIYTQDLPITHEYIRELRSALDEFDDRMMVGEIYLPIERLLPYAGTPDAPECHLPFNFHLILTPWNAADVRKLVDEYDAAVTRSGSWPNWVLGNHDQHRFATRVGRAQYRVAQTLLLTLRGTPTVYYGDEIGMEDGHIPPDRIVDPAALNQPEVAATAGRDPERTPMQWDATPYGGFMKSAADEQVEPWLPLAENFTAVNVAAQETDPASDLNYFRALTKLRGESAALVQGSYRSLNAGEGALMQSGPGSLTGGSYQNVQAGSGVFAFLRESEGERVLVVLNFGTDDVQLSLPELDGAALLLSSMGDGSAETLRGNEAQLWRVG